ncbi:MAG: hypothetical protein WCK42_09540 [Myxococcaceae bacterium]
MDSDILIKLRSYACLDYSVLENVFSDYAKPIDKILRLVKQGDLIRIKKGLYVLANQLSLQPVRKEVLANLIYGPSYISLQYALSHYGLIPERVETVTCMTTGRDKLFHTPIGTFSYKRILPRKYSVGITLVSTQEAQFLMATPEKALADIVEQTKGFKTWKDVSEYLTQDLRIELKDLARLKPSQFKKIAESYKTTSVSLLSQCMENIK